MKTFTLQIQVPATGKKQAQEFVDFCESILIASGRCTPLDTKIIRKEVKHGNQRQRFCKTPE